MQRPEFVPCFAQVQLERGKRMATCAMGSGPTALARDQPTHHAGGPQANHFQWRSENFGFAHVRSVLCDELATLDLGLPLARYQDSRYSRSAELTGGVHRVCESAGNRIFRVLADPIV